MSSIPTKQIDGDVAVGRNVSAGGDANVQGNARIGHDLRVEGWLEAKNIKGPGKGLFKTEAQLREAYPEPREGWWALVSDGLTDTERKEYLGQVYLAVNGKWTAQTGPDGSKLLGGRQTVDAIEFKEDIGDLKQRTENLAEVDSALSGLIAQARLEGNDVLEFDGFAVNAEITSGSAIEPSGIIFNIATSTFIASVQQSQTGGAFRPMQYFPNWQGSDSFGPHTPTGKSPMKSKLYIDRTTNLPYRWDGESLVLVGRNLGYTSEEAFPGDEGAALQTAIESQGKDLKEVMKFDGFLSEEVTIEMASSSHTPGDAGCLVLFSETHGTFILKVAESTGSVIAQPKYYISWPGMDIWKKSGFPIPEKLYIDRTTNLPYRWDGESLVLVGRNLGYTSEEAFPGDEGAALKDKVEALKEETGSAVERLSGRIETGLTRRGTVSFLSGEEETGVIPIIRGLEGDGGVSEGNGTAWGAGSRSVTGKRIEVARGIMPMGANPEYAYRIKHIGSHYAVMRLKRGTHDLSKLFPGGEIRDMGNRYVKARIYSIVDTEKKPGYKMEKECAYDRETGEVTVEGDKAIVLVEFTGWNPVGFTHVAISSDGRVCLPTEGSVICVSRRAENPERITFSREKYEYGDLLFMRVRDSRGRIRIVDCTAYRKIGKRCRCAYDIEWLRSRAQSRYVSREGATTEHKDIERHIVDYAKPRRKYWSTTMKKKASGVFRIRARRGYGEYAGEWQYFVARGESKSAKRIFWK